MGLKWRRRIANRARGGNVAFSTGRAQKRRACEGWSRQALFAVVLIYGPDYAPVRSEALDIDMYKNLSTVPAVAVDGLPFGICSDLR